MLNHSLEKTPLQILIIEDEESDYLLIKRYLSTFADEYCLDWINESKYALHHMLDADYDACLLDFGLGVPSGMELLQQAVASRWKTPIIILTGREQVGLDVHALELGAADYLIKGEIQADQLQRAIRYAIARKKGELEKDNLSTQLQEALAQHTKVLGGFLPICSCCKKIRDDEGIWNQVEKYLRERTEITFTHGVCPDCSTKMLSELDSPAGPGKIVSLRQSSRSSLE
ncbi:MAG: hybrid sensor histidine kinase/response regulator [Verrucomicrobiales bacterium]|nr:hybrid sensor histidine kinase/response regulator [Verrucomicrobiales bacterium]